ncbi:MAG TPA: hypothetical protein VG367_03405 [Mucilaginibacter sp.]|nr:hypothetical protein [Mucilaginibacter sp.]
MHIKLIHLLLFCCPLWFFCCKKQALQKKIIAPACYDFMVADSNTTIPTAPYQEFFYFNTEHKLIKHTAYSGGVIGWSDTFAYDHGHVVKSWMSLGNNSSANYYTRSEYDYTDTLMTASRYYAGANTLIVNSYYTYDDKGRLASYSQHSDNTSLQADQDYTYNLTYDNNDNVTQIADASGTLVATYSNFDDKPNYSYKLPFDYAYDIFSYFNAFSKHNAGTSNSYNSYSHAVTTTNNTYTYANGTVSTINSSAGVFVTVRSLCK